MLGAYARESVAPYSVVRGSSSLLDRTLGLLQCLGGLGCRQGKRKTQAFTGVFYVFWAFSSVHPTGFEPVTCGSVGCKRLLKLGLICSVFFLMAQIFVAQNVAQAGRISWSMVLSLDGANTHLLVRSCGKPVDV